MIKIGIICPSEIALRRFLPALQKDNRFEFGGLAIASPEEWYGENANIVSDEEKKFRHDMELNKAQKFIDFAGGKIYDSYYEILESKDLDAIYLPLPPSLHFKWTKIALDNGKHVFVEKPSTITAADTAELITIAKKNNLALHENYMFIYHDQLQKVCDIVKSGEIGDIRLYRITFGFPRRAQNDFRYNKALGGGALIDAGGYTIKYATFLLGKTAKITTAHLNYIPKFDVDIYGSATIINDEGVTVQLAFGMDCDYKCDIEIWGSKGTITSNRIFTAPAGFIPEYTIKKNQDYETHKLPEDDAFNKSIARFYDCVNNTAIREDEYSLIQKQADLVFQFKEIAE